jgi:hypothetical protein
MTLNCESPRIIPPGAIQMCPGNDGRLSAEFDARPTILLMKAVGTSAFPPKADIQLDLIQRAANDKADMAKCKSKYDQYQ